MVEAPCLESLYAVIASWITPSSLFIFVNLVIGTIFITSRFATTRREQPQRDSPHQLASSPSFLHRVMSFNLGYTKYDSEPEPSTEFALDPIQTHHDSPRLARDDSSLLDRVKSISFGKEETRCLNPDDPTRTELTRAPSLLERLKSMKLYRSVSTKSEKNESGSGIPDSGDPNRTELVRGPSLLERIKSIKLYRLESTKTEIVESGSGSGSVSEPNMDGNESGDGEEEEGVDKKADDFINKFKQQLKMQRLESIIRYRDLFRGN